MAISGVPIIIKSYDLDKHIRKIKSTYNLLVVSSEQESRRDLYGSKATRYTGPECPRRVLLVSPNLSSIMRTRTSTEIHTKTGCNKYTISYSVNVPVDCTRLMSPRCLDDKHFSMSTCQHLPASLSMSDNLSTDFITLSLFGVRDQT